MPAAEPRRRRPRTKPRRAPRSASCASCASAETIELVKCTSNCGGTRRQIRDMISARTGAGKSSESRGLRDSRSASPPLFGTRPPRGPQRIGARQKTSRPTRRPRPCGLFRLARKEHRVQQLPRHQGQKPDDHECNQELGDCAAMPAQIAVPSMHPTQTRPIQRCRAPLIWIETAIYAGVGLALAALVSWIIFAL